MLSVLGVLAATAFTVLAAGGKADFALSMSPSSQTVTGGQSVTATVQLTRQNSYTNAVNLSVSGLPAATTASFSPNPIPEATSTASNSSLLTIKTNVNGTTPAGTSTVTVTGTDGKLTHTTTLTLVIQSATAPNYTVSVSPSVQTILQGDETTYTVAVSRVGGFTGAVALTAADLPAGASASFSPATVPAGTTQAKLTLTTTPKIKTGSFTFKVDGASTVGGAAVTRTASATLDVQQTKEFGIAGSPSQLLVPGVSVPLDLTVSNPNPQAINIVGLSVAVEAATSKQGCSGATDFGVTQIPSSRYPIAVPAGATKTLSQLGVAQAAMPTVTLLNRPVNQDACKNATIHLQYSGTASK